eukprot:NODE_2817_length_499_cov_11.016129_g2767_i0.p2 GENE.NODE_2817_length_499_cov_11.016129_g2767_i0~~NODE_2817_length_499_cov_11.016129_g2767_i0.p2  ORF type:complete len:114 (-),score=24.79 NODE_2817_length_499_cov_11.016129_g2767_i0:102-443(-)
MAKSRRAHIKKKLGQARRAQLAHLEVARNKEMNAKLTNMVAKTAGMDVDLPEKPAAPAATQAAAPASSKPAAQPLQIPKRPSGVVRAIKKGSGTKVGRGAGKPSKMKKLTARR